MSLGKKNAKKGGYAKKSLNIFFLGAQFFYAMMTADTIFHKQTPWSFLIMVFLFSVIAVPGSMLPGPCLSSLHGPHPLSAEGGAAGNAFHHVQDSPKHACCVTAEQTSGSRQCHCNNSDQPGLRPGVAVPTPRNQAGSLQVKACPMLSWIRVTVPPHPSLPLPEPLFHAKSPALTVAETTVLLI